MASADELQVQTKCFKNACFLYCYLPGESDDGGTEHRRSTEIIHSEGAQSLWSHALSKGSEGSNKDLKVTRRSW
jgi:hypothetical protein